MAKSLWLTCFLFPFILSAQQIPKGLTASNGNFIGFYEYKPVDYNANLTTKYPLIIFLHGGGEGGNGTTELFKVKRVGIPSYIDKGNPMRFYWNGKWETFLVLSPQYSGSSRWYYENFYVEEMIKYARANLRIDTNRIILTGLSMGGGGTWAYASESLMNAQKFAAIAPVCAPCLDSLLNYHPWMSSGENLANAKLPVWAFHATQDVNPTTPVYCTYDALDSINKYNPAIKPIKTIYASGGHVIWDRAYDSLYNWQNPNIFEWFLAQDKSLPVNILPVPKAGNDSTIYTPDAQATLNGISSSDVDGNIVKYLWKKISGPSSGVINNASSAIATVSGFTIAGTYRYELKIIDNRVSWSSDTITINVLNGIVPVNYIYFTVVNKNNTAILEWATSKEKDSKFFIVERSEDGNHYASLQTVMAAGNSQRQTNYRYTDLHPVTGTGYYRLKQVDIDGRFSYSKVIRFHFSNSTSFVISPNPAKNEVTINGTNVSVIRQIQLSDLNGKIVKQKLIRPLSPGPITFDVSKITRGVYLIKIISKDEIRAEKLVLD